MPLQREHRLNIRLSRSEWGRLHRLCANSTCRTVSEYARKMLLQQPVKLFFRNPTIEELNEKILPLLDDLADGAVSVSAAKSDLLDNCNYFIEYVEDIRALLAKLNNQCDPK